MLKQLRSAILFYKEQADCGVHSLSKPPSWKMGTESFHSEFCPKNSQNTDILFA